MQMIVFYQSLFKLSKSLINKKKVDKKDTLLIAYQSDFLAEKLPELAATSPDHDKNFYLTQTKKRAKLFEGLAFVVLKYKW